MDNSVYVFDSDDVVDISYDPGDYYGVETVSFEVKKYSVFDTTNAEAYTIELVSKSGESIVTGLTQEEYDNLPKSLKYNVSAYMVLGLRIRRIDRPN